MTRFAWWRLRAALVGLVLPVAAVFAGCTQSSQATSPRGTTVVVFLDLSASIRGEAKSLLERDLAGQIVPALSAGDRLVIVPINDRTLTEFHPLVDVTFPPRPPFNGWLDNMLRYHRQVKEVDEQIVRLREKVQSQVKEIFGGRFSSSQTDIFSSLLLAQKLFHRESRQKVLVLMSDMIEDYPPYRFERMTWKPGATEKLLSELEAKGLVPDLSGVCIYVSGASANSAEMAERIGAFWLAYFQRTGAAMDPSRYAHVLLHWPPAKSCSVG
jgi:hypothetical protein